MPQTAGNVRLLFMIIIHPACLYAQTADTVKQTAPESSYIEKMDQYLIFRVSINNDVQGLVIKNVVRYDIKPNDKNVLKFSVKGKHF